MVDFSLRMFRIFKSNGVFGVAFVVLMCACASWFMKGSSPAKGVPSQPFGTFKISKCTTTQGEDITPPVATYYLASGKKGGLSLYEIDATGQGAEITNHWQDEEGHHFVTYVANSHGWHYIIPDEPGKPGKRLVHPAGTYTVQRIAGTIRLAGQPAATCDLLPEGMEASDVAPTATTTTPTPTATETAPTAPTDTGTGVPPTAPTSPSSSKNVCAPGTTQECVGSGACKGGQQCREDGTGWGACDCGR